MPGPSHRPGISRTDYEGVERMGSVPKNGSIQGSDSESEGDQPRFQRGSRRGSFAFDPAAIDPGDVIVNYNENDEPIRVELRGKALHAHLGYDPDARAAAYEKTAREQREANEKRRQYAEQQKQK